MRRLILTLLTCTLVAGLAVLGSEMLATETPDNLPRALDAQRDMVAAHPTDAAAFNDLGNLLVLAGDLLAAEDAYRRAVELAPREAAYRYNLALLMQQRGAFNKAAEQYRRVVDLAPAYAWGHFQLGVVYEVKGLNRKAIDSYGRALQLDPSLAFPDVNPAVIESSLLTEAMLRAYRRGLAVPQAPRVYLEPQRITSLLIEMPEGGGEAAEGVEDLPDGLSGEGGGMAAGDEMGEAEAPATPGEASEAGEGDAAAEGEGGGRTLSSGDLREGKVNQASPQGRAGYRPPGSRPGQPRTVRTWRPPGEQEGGQRPQGETGGSGRSGQGAGVLGVTSTGAPTRDGRAPDAPATRPGTDRRTPTGVGSTGRLETILDPAPAEQPA